MNGRQFWYAASIRIIRKKANFLTWNCIKGERIGALRKFIFLTLIIFSNILKEGDLMKFFVRDKGGDVKEAQIVKR